MAYRLDDWKCLECDAVSEQLTDSKDPEPVCPHCNSKKLEKMITNGTGDKTHFSWGKWKASV